jgi:hypothetical protein
MRNGSVSPVLQGEQQALDGRVPLKIEFYRGVKEIARFLGMHEQTVQSRLKAGLIPAKKDALGRWVLCNLDYYLSLQRDEDGADQE